MATDNLSVLIAPHLPYLRRFARAMTGTQDAGDALVASVLKALIADRSAMDTTLEPKVGLYKVFHKIWSNERGARAASAASGDLVDQTIARLTPRSRQLLLLVTVEEFSIADAATIMGIDADEAETLQADAQASLRAQARARVMVIEDEPIIALDIESIVTGMGHEVVGIADTHTSAVALSEKTGPDLILADIQLADGSSGIDAVEEILADHTVPVVFITAFPERLLTGERPEPTFLVTKPFRAETVEAAISQALFHQTRE
ncbi:MAG: response regulator [Pseudomonadota bacterium]